MVKANIKIHNKMKERRIKMAIKDGYNKYERYEKLADGDYRKVSYSTSSETVYMTDGTNLQTKSDEIDTNISALDSLPIFTLL